VPFPDTVDVSVNTPSASMVIAVSWSQHAMTRSAQLNMTVEYQGNSAGVVVSASVKHVKAVADAGASTPNQPDPTTSRAALSVLAVGMFASAGFGAHAGQAHTNPMRAKGNRSAKSRLASVGPMRLRLA
jgi:hypothetical protein